jgi:LuxR family maltose regulon positive regulatory protein
MPVDDTSALQRQVAARGRATRGRKAPRDVPGRETLDVLRAKIAPPPLRAGVIPRPALVNGLRRSGARVMKIVAPAGWGKTTLAVQWAAADRRRVVWLSVDAHDNDPLLFTRHLVAGIAGVTAVDPRLLRSLGSSSHSGPETLAAKAAKAVRASPDPLLLVFDNVDLIHSHAARAILLALVSEAPVGSSIALIGRTTPKVPLASLREKLDVEEVTITDLALADRDAEALLSARCPNLTVEETSQLVALCEGWPAGLYLVALAAGETAADGSHEPLGGSDRYLADYLRAEYLAPLRLTELRFVERTSILGDLSAPLCDAVLQTGDASSVLRRLARMQFVVADDARPGRYRYLELLRELLHRQLVSNEPQAVPGLHRRAADWYLRHGNRDSALEHAEAAGDSDRVAPLLAQLTLLDESPSRMLAVELALSRFDSAYRLEEYPSLAVHGSWIHAFRGRTPAATRWLAAAERGLKRRASEAAALRPRIAVVNAALCRRGPRRMLADAGMAVGRLRPDTPWYPAALHMRGVAALLLSLPGEAEALLAAAVASPAATHETQAVALSQLAFLARDRGDTAQADQLAVQARGLTQSLEGQPTTAIALAAAADSALRHGHWADARELVRAADPLTPFLTDALPWLAISTRLELARSYLTLRDVAAARVFAAEIDSLLDARPRVGTLADDARSLRHEVTSARVPDTDMSGLTAAELRLVPLLATHLSFREIADALHVSRNTVKTQAISIYRKLGVSGRSEAIAAAEELGVHVTGEL